MVEGADHGGLVGGVVTRVGICRQCEEHSKQLVSARRTGGGTYRRAPREYRSSICLPCARRLFENAPTYAMATVEGWSVQSLQRAVELARLRMILTRFCDDDSGRDPFHGYTDGRSWNGFACPHLPLSEFLRMLNILVEWGDEKSYEVIDNRNVSVRGAAEDDVHVMSATLQTTTDGDQWLFDCGGAWTFVEATTQDGDVNAPPSPCTHPDHRLGTRGGLKKHQRVCLQCGAVVLAPRRVSRHGFRS